MWCNAERARPGSHQCWLAPSDAVRKFHPVIRKMKITRLCVGLLVMSGALFCALGGCAVPNYGPQIVRPTPAPAGIAAGETATDWNQEARALRAHSRDVMGNPDDRAVPGERSPIP
jgi:hypothetical protein